MSSPLTDRTAGIDLQSRARLAGYHPEVLFSAKVLVVGVGALGQNLTQDLALSGVGELAVIDDDDFEPHNATRSPLYPTTAELSERGPGKAVNVASRLAAIMTAPAPVVWWKRAMVQELGDAPIAWADVVCSAVDNPGARGYLAERCRIVGRPLVEAGFEGPSLNVGVFEADVDAACYRCINPEVRGAFSCTAYAFDADAARVVPAIQNAAAVLGALQAEQVVARLHGAAPLAGRRAYLDVRTLAGRVAQLAADPMCPGVHQPIPPATAALAAAVRSTDGAAAVLDGLYGTVGPLALRLPAPLVLAAACTACGEVAAAGAPEWRWMRAPRCRPCGGPFPRAALGARPAAADWLSAGAGVGQTTMADLGCGPGTHLLAELDHGGGGLARIVMAGSMADSMSAIRG